MAPGGGQGQVEHQRALGCGGFSTGDAVPIS